MFLSAGGHPRGDNDQINQYDDNTGEWVLVLVSFPFPHPWHLLTMHVRRVDGRGGHHRGDCQCGRHGVGGRSQQLHLLPEEEAVFQYTT